MKIAVISTLTLALLSPTFAPAMAQDVGVGVGRSGVEMHMDSNRDRGARDHGRDRSERIVVRRDRGRDRDRGCRMMVIHSHRHGMDVVRRVRRCG